MPKYPVCAIIPSSSISKYMNTHRSMPYPNITERVSISTQLVFTQLSKSNCVAIRYFARGISSNHRYFAIYINIFTGCCRLLKKPPIPLYSSIIGQPCSLWNCLPDWRSLRHHVCTERVSPVLSPARSVL